MFDLTHATWRPNRYGGSEKKRTLLFDGKIYMVKFPEPPRSKKVFVSYTGNQFSEHIGCQIFQILGSLSIVMEKIFEKFFRLPAIGELGAFYCLG